MDCELRQQNWLVVVGRLTYGRTISLADTQLRTTPFDQFHQQSRQPVPRQRDPGSARGWGWREMESRGESREFLWKSAGCVRKTYNHTVLDRLLLISALSSDAAATVTGYRWTVISARFHALNCWQPRKDMHEKPCYMTFNKCVIYRYRQTDGVGGNKTVRKRIGMVSRGGRAGMKLKSWFPCRSL